MVVVKIEVWPGGDPTLARQIGEMQIINNVTATLSSLGDLGDYDAGLKHAGRYWGKPGVWKRGKVTGFDRKDASPYHLVAKCLAACGIR